MQINTKPTYEIQERYSLPYVDWNKIRTEVKDNDCYYVCTGCKTGSNYDYSKEPAFTTAKRFSAQRLAESFERSDFSYSDVVKLTGCDRATLCRSIKGNKGLCIPVSNVENVAHNFMQISLHNFLFGEECRLVLPATLNSIAAGMTKLDETQVDQIYNITAAAIEKQNREFTSPVTPYTLYFRDGLELYARTVGALVCAPFRDDTPFAVRAIYTKVLHDDNKDPKMPVIMYAALCSNMPIDFWICRHYADWVDMYYTKNGEEHVIENKEIKQTIENLSRLHDLKRNSAFLEVMHIVMRNSLGLHIEA